MLITIQVVDLVDLEEVFENYLVWLIKCQLTHIKLNLLLAAIYVDTFFSLRGFLSATFYIKSDIQQILCICL